MLSTQHSVLATPVITSTRVSHSVIARFSINVHIELDDWFVNEIKLSPHNRLQMCHMWRNPQHVASYVCNKKAALDLPLGGPYWQVVPIWNYRPRISRKLHNDNSRQVWSGIGTWEVTYLFHNALAANMLQSQYGLLHTWYVRQALSFPFILLNLVMPLFCNGTPLFYICLHSSLFLFLTCLYSSKWHLHCTYIRLTLIH